MKTTLCLDDTLIHYAIVSKLFLFLLKKKLFNTLVINPIIGGSLIGLLFPIGLYMHIHFIILPDLNKVGQRDLRATSLRLDNLLSSMH